MNAHAQQLPRDKAPGAKPRAGIPALTGLRFLAAIDVVLYHFARNPMPGWATPIKHLIGAGFAGVSLFFVLSGFILSYTYLTPAGTLKGSRRNFWVSRFARIYPAYLLGFLLAAPSNISTSMHVNDFLPAMAKLGAAAVALLSMQQAWTPYTAWAWNYPAWSVSCEVFFYLLFPFLAPVLARVRASRSLALAAGLWVASLIAPMMLYILRGPTGPPSPGAYLPMAVEFTPLLRLPEFAIGILLGCAFTAGRFQTLRGRYLAPVAMALILLVMLGSGVIPHIFLACGLLTPLFGLLLVALAQDSGPLSKVLSTGPMVLLGEASYGIYILQIPVAYAFGWPPPLYSLGGVVLSCFVLVVVSVLSFRYLESPLRVRIRNWLGERRDLETRTPAPAGSAIPRRTLLWGAATTAGIAAAATVLRPFGVRASQRLMPPDGTVWVSSTAKQPWKVGTLPAQESRWNTASLKVHVDAPLQTIEGFGGSFNEFGWLALQSLSDSDRQGILREFFAPGVGANFNLCRTPLGANDFVTEWYSYDEVPGDFGLEHFSVDRDRKGVLPFIKAAQGYAPGLRLWASPWSPPQWMKQNNFYAEDYPTPGEPPNGIRKDQLGRESTDMFRVEEPYLHAYAQYFGRYIDAYRAEGVPVKMVMPQNEYNSPHPFPSCTWSAERLAKFVRHLGPVMKQRGVEVFLGTIERPDPQLARVVLSDDECRVHIKGLGAQWAGRPALKTLHEEYPDLRIFATEQECGDGHNTWKFCVYCWNLMRENFELGASAYMYWNLALKVGGESHWGEYQNSLVTVDPGAGTFRYNPEFYLLKHVSHFVQPGSRYLRTTGLLADALAFLNPDGSLVVAMRNELGTARTVDVVVGGRSIVCSMEGNSINTMLVPGMV
jgi:glucosylceramidase